MKRTASCSDVQQLAEQLMVTELSRELGRTLAKATIPVGTSKVAVDGFHREGNQVILAEAWAHVGRARSAQRNKVLGNMLKLVFVTTILRRSHPDLTVESYIIFADGIAANVVNGNGWASLAANEFGITPRVVTLSEDVLTTIKEAQRRQDIRISDDSEGAVS